MLSRFKFSLSSPLQFCSSFTDTLKLIRPGSTPRARKHSCATVLEHLECRVLTTFTIIQRAGVTAISSDGSTVIGNDLVPPFGTGTGWVWDATRKFDLSYVFWDAAALSGNGQYLMGLGPYGGFGGAEPDLFDRDFESTEVLPGGSTMVTRGNHIFNDLSQYASTQKFTFGTQEYYEHKAQWGGLSDDGKTIVSSGAFYPTGLDHFPSWEDSRYFTLVWDDKNKWKAVNVPDFIATEVSADGSVFGGTLNVSPTRDFIFATRNGVLKRVPGEAQSGVNDLSPDGRFIAGWVSDQNFNSPVMAVRVSQAGFTHRLGTLPDFENSQAWGVSTDGKIVVGESYDQFNSLHTTSRAFIWTQEDGIQDLTSYLKEREGTLYGLTLTSAMGISADGRSITGTAIDESGNPVSWIWHGPHIVNVVTHGFGNGAFPGFMDPWYQLDKELEDIPYPGSIFDEPGAVSNYVSNWDSSSGWLMAATSTIVAAIETVHGNAAAAALASYSAKSYMKIAARQAEEAAQKIVRDLTDPANGLLSDPDLSVAGAEIINLIGHSRGAAVNARVAQLLTEKGYIIDQYTSLDGYSTDWPGTSSKLSDISIVDAISQANVRNKINFQVEDGLLQFVAHGLLDILGDVLGSPFSPSTIALVEKILPGWKAPNRAGFENITVTNSLAPATHSHHLNIVEWFTDSGTKVLPIAERYLWASYLGRHQTDGTGIPNPDVPPYGGGRQTRSIVGPVEPRGFTLRAAASNADEVLPPDDLDEFLDGTFEDFSSIRSQLDELDLSGETDPAILSWGAMIQDAQVWLRNEWNAQGDVQLVQENGNSLVELSSRIPSSISQQILFTSIADGVTFDTAVLNAHVGDRLVVKLGTEVLQEIPLDDLLSTQTLFVPLPTVLSNIDTIEFQVEGNATDPVRVRLDNIKVHHMPQLTGIESLTPYLANDPGPAIVKTLQIQSDTADFSESQLSITFLDGTKPADTLMIDGTVEGTGVSLNGDEVIVGGRVVATWVAGTPIQPLRITFAPNATAPDVQKIVSSIILGNSSQESSRHIEVVFSDSFGSKSESLKTYLLPNTPPKITNTTTIAIYGHQKDGLVIQPGALITDLTSTNLDNGKLTVAVVTNRNPADQLKVLDSIQKVTVSGTKLSIDGRFIGTISGGVGASPLTVTFTASATPNDATDVLQSVRFIGSLKKSKKLPRTLEISVTDGDGGASLPFRMTVRRGTLKDLKQLQGRSK